MFRTALALLLSLTLIAQPAAAFAHQAEYSSESKTIGVSTGVTGISPSFSPGFSAEDKASSQTLATISPGAIITGEPTDLSGLNRDKTKAHQKLEKIFDLEALKEDAEFAEVASEVVSRATAPILKMIGEKYTDKEIDTVTHKLLHAVVGCGTGALTGGDCASGAVGAVAAEVAVEIAVNVQTQALVAKLRKEGGEPSAKDIETISQNAQLVGKFTSLATALGLGLNEHSANLAGTNAAENNCGGGWCVAAIIFIISAALTTYDVVTTYQEEGGEAALKQLLRDGAISVVGAGAGKIAYKIGGKVFKSGPKAWEAVKKTGLYKKVARNGAGDFLKTFDRNKFRFFKGDEANTHFGKHSQSLMGALGKSSYNLKNYIDDAHHVIKNGTYVPELNGFVRLIGGKGSAKYGFVGLNRSTGQLTTFHIKKASDLSKTAPSLGIVK